MISENLKAARFSVDVGFPTLKAFDFSVHPRHFSILVFGSPGGSPQVDDLLLHYFWWSKSKVVMGTFISASI